MLKGCQKKIIFLKDTGCDIFEEAYFVINPEYEGMNKSDIVNEATKIASEIYQDKKNRKDKNHIVYSLFLSIGMLIGVVVSVGCFFLLG
ncbi:MAG: hypothetical protein IKA02_03300 [Clostridia bacterium]|nr:hypothetical protein [Clostridia bacterium]